MPRGNPSPKLAITVDPEIHEKILAAAARDGVSVSAWMTAAAREALQRRAGLAAVALWERQHGRFTPEEMDEARRSVRAQLRTQRRTQKGAGRRPHPNRPLQEEDSTRTDEARNRATSRQFQTAAEPKRRAGYP